jgi:hypothetical protein
MLDFLTIVELWDVDGKPRAKLSLPGRLHVGDKVRLKFVLNRDRGGRKERVDATGEWRVVTVVVDLTQGIARQDVSLVNVGVTPSWKAIKKRVSAPRSLALARSDKEMVW